MRKLLLSLSLACLASVGVSNAQTVIMSQGFGAPTVAPALPATWSQNSPSASPGWFTSTSAGSTWGSLTGYFNIPSHAQYVVVDDAAHAGNLHDTLKSPVFSLTGYSGVWMNYQYFFYKAINSSSGLAESCFILGSTNGGTTWSVIDSVPGNGFDGTDVWDVAHTSLASLSGANCRIAYVYSDGGGAILGCALDSVQVVVPPADDAALNAIYYNEISAGVSTNGQQLLFQFTNNSGTNVTSIKMYYSLNGGAPVVQTFTGLSVTPYTSSVQAFSTPFSGLVAGTNTLRIGILQVNGASDPDADSVITSSFVLATATAQRNGLIEEFSSSTCNPCHAFNSQWDPLANSLNVNVPATHINELRYQMNWPDWDDDRSYNADGASRQSFYGVNSIPEHFVNGILDQYNWSYPFSSADNTFYTNEINGSDTTKCYFDMSATYTIDTGRKLLNVNVTVTPHFTVTGGTFHVYIAAADKHYQNIDNEWGQLDYYNVERKMFPSGAGSVVTAWTSGTGQTFTFNSQAYTSGNWSLATTTPADTATAYPAMHSNTFWSNPLLGSELVAFVQEDKDGAIMQSIVALPTSATVGVSTLSHVNQMNVFPNPTKDGSTLQFTLEQAGDVNIKVIDYTGKTISMVSEGNMTQGVQKVFIPTTGIVPGNYIVMVTTEGGSNIVRLTVE